MTPKTAFGFLTESLFYLLNGTFISLFARLSTFETKHTTPHTDICCCSCLKTQMECFEGPLLSLQDFFKRCCWHDHFRLKLETMETLKSPTVTCSCPPPPLLFLQPALPAVLVEEAATQTQEGNYMIDYVLQNLTELLND